jgi:hypothetical protein
MHAIGQRAVLIRREIAARRAAKIWRSQNLAVSEGG